MHGEFLPAPPRALHHRRLADMVDLLNHVQFAETIQTLVLVRNGVKLASCFW